MTYSPKTTAFSKKGKNNKGGFFDVLGLILAIPFLLVVIVILFIAYTNTADGLTEFQSTNTHLAGINESTQTFVDTTNQYPAFWDFLFVFLVFGIWLTIFITSFILGNSPIFLAIYIIMSFTLLVVAIVLELALGQFTSNPQIAPFMLSFPMMLHVVDNLVVYSLFFICSIAVALYLKRGGQ